MEPQENLKELFERFVDCGQAAEAAGDIEEGLEIVGRYPAPEPDTTVIERIKINTAKTLREKKGKAGNKTIYRTAAAAAAVLLLAGLSIRVIEHFGDWAGARQAQFAMDAAVWESDDIADADAELAVLAAEIHEVENEIVTLRFGNMNGIEYEVETDLEMELIEIDSDFWKG